MNGKAKLLIAGVSLALAAGVFYAGFLKGWYAHSEYVNSQAKTRGKEAGKGGSDWRTEGGDSER
ncbi:Uncharacterised protein [Klebsiella pneumoniae]|uniref:Uncharacterized protein n=1 Tax=Klebsiella pneumoniae TaxID=573 RepID=A0A2X3CH52_KLEPN|nr:Uncharacterised protein [Klebsiella pneumoniae]